MRILIVQNLWESESFVSGGVFDGENFGLKAKKKTHKRTPQKCPKGPPEGKLGESASHQISELRSGGEPSTWSPPGRLAEHLQNMCFAKFPCPCAFPVHCLRFQCYHHLPKTSLILCASLAFSGSPKSFSIATLQIMIYRKIPELPKCFPCSLRHFPWSK